VIIGPWTCRTISDTSLSQSQCAELVAALWIRMHSTWPAVAVGDHACPDHHSVSCSMLSACITGRQQRTHARRVLPPYSVAAVSSVCRWDQEASAQRAQGQADTNSASRQRARHFAGYGRDHRPQRRGKPCIASGFKIIWME